MASVPFKGKLKSLWLISYSNPNKEIDLIPQVMEIDLYQSIYSNLIRADVIISDPIGLFVNFPLTGEEILVAEFDRFADEVVKGKRNTVKHVFVIDFVKDISLDKTGREVTFVLGLSSRPAYENSKHRVSHAFTGLYSEAAKSIFNLYLREPAQITSIPPFKGRTNGSKDLYFFDVEQSNEISGTIVVPNMYPLDAITWMSQKARSAIDNHYNYLFYQDIDGFHFKTSQQISQEAFKNTSKTKDIYDETYAYMSNNINTAKNVVKDQYRVINNVHFEKRHSTQEKIKRGYFENSLLEINLLQKAYKSTPTSIDQGLNTRQLLGPYILDTGVYSRETKSAFALPPDRNNAERYNRVTYYFNNRPEQEPDTKYYDFRDRWGEYIRSIAAFDQIDVVITIEGNLDILPGTIIRCMFPEMHGFNIINEDKFISGNFMVTDVRHIFLNAKSHSTILRLNKDSYEIDVNSAPFKYGNK